MPLTRELAFLNRCWWRSSEPGDFDAFTEEDFYAVRAKLESLNDAELAAFRSLPENQRLLRDYDSFAFRQVFPYAAALLLLSVFSLIVAWALSA